ncbi:hypothetical protein RMSM_07738 [Rhodopirellula maiorica SM1]|uniref:Uncharacterized protein n=1 Tax=Rhodopirellula maiorica SM1 TaxID=1265738 RepID=M5R7I5_9BACT|nr:hypothetical protein RMSM_07738 [Rhodopirellula maiorica SM1]
MRKAPKTRNFGSRQRQNEAFVVIIRANTCDLENGSRTSIAGQQFG